MKVGRSYRLYPSKEQIKGFERVFRASRFVWNWYLGWRYQALLISNIRKWLEGKAKVGLEAIFRDEILRSVNKRTWRKIKDMSLSDIMSEIPENHPSSKVQLILNCWSECGGDLIVNKVDLWHKQYCLDLEISLDKNLSDMDIQRKLTGMKSSCPWLNIVPAQVLVGTCRTAHETFQKWFSKKCKAPRFKSRHGYVDSFSIQNNRPKPAKNGLMTYQNRVESDGGRMAYLTIPKFPKIKMKLHRPVGGPIGTVTISKTATGDYYVSFPVEIDYTPEIREVNEETSRGIDVGITSFITDDRGHKISPGIFKDEKLEEKRKYLQRKLELKRGRSPDWRFSKRYHRERVRLSRVEQKIAKRRSDFLHKSTHELIIDEKVGLIGIEDLGIKGMLRNKKLARAISNASWYEYRRQLEYKSAQEGIVVQSVSRMYPSSKLCSVCGHKNTGLTLGDREWECPRCHTWHDRDQNAAINIKNQALKLYREKQ